MIKRSLPAVLCSRPLLSAAHLAVIAAKLCFPAMFVIASPVWSQQSPTASAPLPSTSYLSLALPSRIVGLVMLHGNRFYTPGEERVTLSGTWTDSTGSSPAVLTKEIPNKVRLVIGGSMPRVLLADGSSTNVGGATATGQDQNILESLENDGPEGLFYSFGSSAGHMLGGLFRIDGGTNANYAGPWYDLWEVFQKVAVRPGSPIQQKVFYFDSHTQQFARCRYKTKRNGAVIDVQTRYSGWTKVSGQLLPGTIQRFENGVSVFTFTATSSAVSPAQNDGIFANP